MKRVNWSRDDIFEKLSQIDNFFKSGARACGNWTKFGGEMKENGNFGY